MLNRMKLKAITEKFSPLSCNSTFMKWILHDFYGLLKSHPVKDPWGFNSKGISEHVTQVWTNFTQAYRGSCAMVNVITNNLVISNTTSNLVK